MTANKPCILGLTGGIACGKSNVSRMLSHAGLPVIDADALSKELTAPGGAALPLIFDLFGAEVFLPDGSLDRAALGERVFHSPDALQQLNAVMHPMVFSLMADRLLLVNRFPIVVLEVPLMFETGADRLCDEIWTVETAPDEQLARLMRRGGFTEEQARARIDAQLPSETRRSLSDVVIDSSGPYPETRLQVAQALSDLKRRLGIEPSV